MKPENLVPKAELSSLTDTEFLVENVLVHGKNCVGCLRWDKDILVSFMDDNKKYESGIGKCFDLLLTNKQAIYLRDKLTEELERNLRDEVTTLDREGKKIFKKPKLEKLISILKQSHAYKQTDINSI